MRTLLSRALASAALALALGPSGALGATTRVDEFSETGVGPYAHVNYIAAGGEANRLTLTLNNPSQWVFEDAGATIEADERCVGGGSHRVTCLADGTTRMTFVYLMDGDDELTVPSNPAAPITPVRALGGEGRDVMRATGPEPASPFVDLDGGAGDDEISSTRGGLLVGADGADTLRGSRHADSLSGGPGGDTLVAGAGSDSLAPGNDSDPDLVDGGPGRDHLSYESVDPADFAPLTIDLATMTAAPGDTLDSIEAVTGGGGPDVMRGSTRGDSLGGGSGDDSIAGGAGDDGLDGHEGDDVIAGGPGDDRLAGWDGLDELAGGSGDDFVDPWRFDFGDRRERVSCGSGRDVIFLPDAFREVAARFRRVPADCESLEAGESRLGRFAPRPRVADGRARWSLRCSNGGAWRGRCPVTFELRAGGRSIGSGSVDLRRGRRGTLEVPLSEAGRRRVRDGGRLEVGIRMKSDHGGWSPGRLHRFEIDLPPAG